MSQNVLIVGANRGIGLQLVKEVLAKLNPTKVFATYRNAEQSKELLELAATNPTVRPIQLDAVDDTKYPAVVQLVEKETNGAGLNLLIFNAGIYTDRTSLTKEVLLCHFEVNSVAPLLFAHAFLPLLEKASAANSSAPLGISRGAIVNVSTIMSSCALYDVSALAGPSYAYRASKSAQNMATKTLSVDIKEKNVLAVAIHPGWVKTDMGGPDAHLTVEQSAEGIVKVLSNLNESQNGKLLQFDGETLPW